MKRFAKLVLTLAGILAGIFAGKKIYNKWQTDWKWRKYFPEK